MNLNNDLLVAGYKENMRGLFRMQEYIWKLSREIKEMKRDKRRRLEEEVDRDSNQSKA